MERRQLADMGLLPARFVLRGIWRRAVADPFCVQAALADACCLKAA
nr:hypothetical protein [uncultured Kingella sp.]